MTARRGKVGELYWHVHHQQLAEFLIEPIANRRHYIREEKPAAEVPIRLKWLTPVKGEVPAGLTEARAASDKARAAYIKAWAACQPALEALHAKEHPRCPWDGRTLLPEEAKR